MKSTKQLKQEIESLLILHQASDVTVSEVLEIIEGFEKELKQILRLELYKFNSRGLIEAILRDK